MTRFLFLISLLCLTACSTTSLSTQTMILTEQDNNKTLQLAVGDSLTIRLKENPTTGYQWAIDGSSDIIALEKEDYVLDAMPNLDGHRLVGGGGTKILQFSVKKSGHTTLKLKYWRAWEKDASIVERFTVTINAE